MRNKIRFLCNMMIDIDHHGTITNEFVSFGKLYIVNYIQETDDAEFIDIYLDNGAIIYGINRHLIEYYDVTIKPYEHNNTN